MPIYFDGVRDSDPQKYPTPSITVGDETEYRAVAIVVELPRAFPVSVAHGISTKINAGET